MPECVTTTFHPRTVQSNVASSPNKANDKIQWVENRNGWGVRLTLKVTTSPDVDLRLYGSAAR